MKRLCRWFGCTATTVAWLSSNTVQITCRRCGQSTTWRRR